MPARAQRDTYQEAHAAEQIAIVAIASGSRGLLVNGAVDSMRDGRL